MQACCCCCIAQDYPLNTTHPCRLLLFDANQTPQLCTCCCATSIHTLSEHNEVSQDHYEYFNLILLNLCLREYVWILLQGPSCGCGPGNDFTGGPNLWCLLCSCRTAPAHQVFSIVCALVAISQREYLRMSNAYS